MPARMAETRDYQMCQTHLTGVTSVNYLALLPLRKGPMLPSLEPGQNFMTMLANRIEQKRPSTTSRGIAWPILGRQPPCWEEAQAERTQVGVPAAATAEAPCGRQHELPVPGVNEILDDSRAQSLTHPQPSSFFQLKS